MRDLLLALIPRRSATYVICLSAILRSVTGHAIIDFSDNHIRFFPFPSRSAGRVISRRSERGSPFPRMIRWRLALAKGKTQEHVVIVGGSSGMGLALAERLLSAGSRVTIVGRSDERLSRAREKLANAPALQTFAADCTREEEVERLFRSVDDPHHIVSTAADVSGVYVLLPEMDISAARRVLDSKVIAPLLLAKHGAPRLPRGGSITFTSGIAAYRPAPKGSVVAAVNGAIESLVYALAVELAPVRVNAISPGWVDTPIWDTVAGDGKTAALEAMAKRLPVGRIGQAEDIAQAIDSVMRNGFISGTVVHVDGGQRLV
jgi:NAD(P)-dependent dehydrogenase (short-subunit alcohol dehydrogenase family)